MKRLIFPLLLFFGLLFGCKSKSAVDEADGSLVRTEQKKEEILVRVAPVRRDQFNLELVSNGKSEAIRKAVLAFEVSEVVRRVHVKNGERVRAGDPLVAVDDRQVRRAIEEAELNMDKALMDIRGDFIAEGLDLKTMDDTLKVAPERKEVIFLQRGYTAARRAVRHAQEELEKVVTRAPFAGIVADMEAKEFNHSSAYKSVCTLIDDSQMEVVFNVLETEIGNLEPEMEVEITPYADPAKILRGKITEVNPRIDENGMVKVKAVTPNRPAVLVDGMNVSILVKRRIDDKLIIPKSAVLPRQGRKVVFVYSEGRAHWKYVTTGYENSTEVSVEEGLAEGDQVIYENNLGLSHMNEVTVIPNQ